MADGIRVKAVATFAVAVFTMTVAAPIATAANRPPARGFGPVVQLRQISADPLTNPDAQHATQVEPDTFSNGRTVVATFQSGRFADGGSDTIGFAVSHNAGVTWSSGFVPALTVWSQPPGGAARASDPTVTFDAAHNTWVITSLLLNSVPAGSGIAISRSTDDGEHWSAPTIIDSNGAFWDKNWAVCDNTPTSPFFGHCYLTWDEESAADLGLSATSTDGGLTWSPPARTANNDHVFAGQPVVQPDGTVTVPAIGISLPGFVAYQSTDGGATWGPAYTINTFAFHAPAGGLRASVLPTADVGPDGTIYLAWADCRFRTACASNDIVVSTSADGKTWSAPARVPIDAETSTVDHFIPGITTRHDAAATDGTVALSYYWYPHADCTRTTCELHVGAIVSPDRGMHWSDAEPLSAAATSLTAIAVTTQGVMVGDYISSSIANQRMVTVFAQASPPDSSLHESTFAASVHLPPNANVTGQTTPKFVPRGRGADVLHTAH